GATRQGGRLLAGDLARRLVDAQPVERRMPQLPVGRPLGEADLRDELRTYEVALLRQRDAAGRERRRALLARREVAVETLQRRVVEAGPAAADVAQPAALLHAEQQRAEADPRARRLGVAPDDELLALRAADLAPGRRAPAFVDRIAALRDDALDA